MTEKNVKIPAGSLVYSRRGHDAGRLFVTLAEPDKTNCVPLADGMLRKVQKPKRKKVVHIELTTAPEIDITALTNKMAAAAVKRYRTETDSSELAKG